ncbi:MAG: cysteine desulfurase family protein [Bacteroidia bacterium]|nr:cysteine desulfurase family protein [Bacteroidia bacterium]
MKIYLDNAASSPMAPEVFDHIKPYLLEFQGNPSSTHAHGRFLRNALEEARRLIASNLKVSPSEIFFTSGGTEADNTAIIGAIKAYQIRHIVSTRIEHHAVTHTIEHLEAEGTVEVTWLKVDRHGHIDYTELENVLTERPHSLVSLMHGNNELGTLHDIELIGEICRRHQTLFHSDTVQTMGNVPLDFSRIPVDFAAASAHKFYGPKGVGFLFVRKGVKIPPLIWGGGQERNMRAGTENVAFIAGMAYALDHCYRNLEAKTTHILTLKQYLKTQLEQAIPGVRFNGDPDQSLPSVLNTTFPCGEEDAMLLFHLDLAGISASGGSACSSGALMGSHVLREIGADNETLLNSVRFSFGVQNTREEIDFLVETMKKLVPQPVR